ncbi:MAG: hypothetical protein Q7U91_00155 [Sideroxyarcus sp.]|nr:hypothetical protein [Sideroxyarcus sp.]
MIIKSAGVSFIPPHVFAPADNVPASSASSPAATADTVSISDTARALQSRAQADTDTRGQWATALANRSTGIPQLVRADSALAGGVEDIQERLRLLLSERGLPSESNFSLSYDAAAKLFRVDGEPGVKAALEAELNASSPTPNAAAIREGYALLEDIDTGLAAVRAQYARDQAAGSDDVASRQHGFAYRFNLNMSGGALAVALALISKSES